MGIRRYHIEKDSIERDDVLSEAIDIYKIDTLTLQTGRTTVTFPFSATGVEEVTASISFPKSYPTGKVPCVVFSHSHIDISVRLDSITETGFTLRAKDNLGVDFTAGVSVTVNWIAIYPR